ncbi:uncharacterized protein FOMMEDRAFT_144646 [Fomitiporia mediterranea MF3/22]|uniref:uncharacterized protein n=1 Tax=Fomitiporia mediterranea (strain MF3/22) TaxID=694068 RepID=UPI00044078C0|nr:uncharacterized protein FOMMEDRAFT_144646 [Fomitiporia mediterranea MF3/22]EJD06722.1 hypothetical protein FOMMEDRAFT_144646 [Fomitiporia mediterranea MF3/22]
MFICTCYVCAELTLVLRAYALWKQSRIACIVLLIVGSGSAVGGYYLSVTQGLSGKSSPIKLFHSGCIIAFSGTHLWIGYLTLVCCETISFGLVLARAVMNYRDSGSFNKLMKTMVTSGILYYLCLIFIALGNMILLRFQSRYPRGLYLINLQGILCCILCNRLLLHLRRNNTKLRTSVATRST